MSQKKCYKYISIDANHEYYDTYVLDVSGVNESSRIKWLQLQNCLKITETTFISSKLFPRISAGPQKPQKLTSLKIKSEKFGPKILIPR